MARIERKVLLEKFRGMIARRQPIIGGGAGTGLSAQCEEAGGNGPDPFAIMDHLLDHLKALGFSGVQNFPTVGLFDGVFRKNLEETGMGYGLEVDMIRKAHERDMLTTPYVFSADGGLA